MSIPIQKLLGKMDEELYKAKGAGTDRQIREHVHAIRTMCELILENQQENETSRFTEIVTLPKSDIAKPLQPQTVIQAKRLQEDGEANGDSLFDF